MLRADGFAPSGRLDGRLHSQARFRRVRPTYKPTPKTGNQVLYGTNGIRLNTKDSNLVPSALIIIQFVPSAVALLNVSLDYCFFLLIYLTNSSILIASWRFKSTQFYLNDKMEKYNNI